MLDWANLSKSKEMVLTMKAHEPETGILFFCRSEYFLNMKKQTINGVHCDGLFPRQAELLQKFYSYKDGKRVYNELWFGAGMRSSKTTICGIINCYETYRLIELQDPAEHYGFTKGQQIFLINAAINTDQAHDTIFRKTKERIDSSPYFQTGTKYKEIYNEFYFPDQEVIIRSGGSSSASLVGKTAKVVNFDELSRFKNTSGQMSGRSVVESLGRSVADFGLEGLITSTTSPLFTNDPFMILREEARRSPYALVTDLIPTWEFNPRYEYDGPFMTAKRLQNPEAFWRDYGARPDKSIQSYYQDTQVIDDAISKHRLNWAELDHFPAPEAGVVYVACGDPATKFDAYGIAMGHMEGAKIVFDLLWRIEPVPGKAEVDMAYVHKYYFELMRHFGIRQMGFDIRADSEFVQNLQRESCNVIVENILKKQHDKMKELIYARRIEFCNYPHVVTELKGLQQIRGANIDHSELSSKDVSDAATHVVWLLTQDEEKDKKDLPTPLYAVTLWRRSRY